ncbi:citrate synthase [Bordetella pertussis]|nr:citrate synthase [Bordetella pertussis]
MMKQAIAEAGARNGAPGGAGGRMPGFGNPPHARDPRPRVLLEVARCAGTAGIHCELLLAAERHLAAAKGRDIPINIDGIVAALALDLGLPDGCAAALVMIARKFSVLTHYLEEKGQNTKWRHVPQECVHYTGPMPS